MKKKKSRSVPIYIIILAVLFIVVAGYSFIAPFIYQIDLSDIDLRSRMLPPDIFGGNSGHLLGTDHMGRDIFIRLWYAIRTSLSITFVGLITSLLLGTALGVLGGMCGGWVDDIIVFLVNVRISIPPILIGIVVATVFGTGSTVLLVLTTLIYWTGFTRIVRSEIMRIRTENFIECSRSIGASSTRILFEHIIPNIASPLIVTTTLNISGILLFESSMSYLGLGVVPPDTSLGLMISTGRDQMISSPWLVLWPIIAVSIVMMSISLIGDWVRDKLDPKMRGR